MQVKLPAEELDAVSDLRQGWKRLRRRAKEAGEELHRLQVRACAGTCRHDIMCSAISAAVSEAKWCRNLVGCFSGILILDSGMHCS